MLKSLVNWWKRKDVPQSPPLPEPKGTVEWWKEAALWLRSRERQVMPSDGLSARRRQNSAVTGDHGAVETSDVPTAEEYWKKYDSLTRDEFAERRSRVEELFRRLEA